MWGFLFQRWELTKLFWDLIFSSFKPSVSVNTEHLQSRLETCNFSAIICVPVCHWQQLPPYNSCCFCSTLRSSPSPVSPLQFQHLSHSITDSVHLARLNVAQQGHAGCRGSRCHSGWPFVGRAVHCHRHILFSEGHTNKHVLYLKKLWWYNHLHRRNQLTTLALLLDTTYCNTKQVHSKKSAEPKWFIPTQWYTHTHTYDSRMR